MRLYPYECRITELDVIEFNSKVLWSGIFNIDTFSDVSTYLNSIIISACNNFYYLKNILKSAISKIKKYSSAGPTKMKERHSVSAAFVRSSNLFDHGRHDHSNDLDLSLVKVKPHEKTPVSLLQSAKASLFIPENQSGNMTDAQIILEFLHILSLLPTTDKEDGLKNKLSILFRTGTLDAYTIAIELLKKKSRYYKKYKSGLTNRIESSEVTSTKDILMQLSRVKLENFKSNSYLEFVNSMHEDPVIYNEAVKSIIEALDLSRAKFLNASKLDLQTHVRKKTNTSEIINNSLANCGCIFDFEKIVINNKFIYLSNKTIAAGAFLFIKVACISISKEEAAKCTNVILSNSAPELMEPGFLVNAGFFIDETVMNDKYSLGDADVLYVGKTLLSHKAFDPSIQVEPNRKFANYYGSFFVRKNGAIGLCEMSALDRVDEYSAFVSGGPLLYVNGKSMKNDLLQNNNFDFLECSNNPGNLGHLSLLKRRTLVAESSEHMYYITISGEGVAGLDLNGMYTIVENLSRQDKILYCLNFNGGSNSIMAYKCQKESTTTMLANLENSMNATKIITYF
jgi:hypothetical protein